MNLIQALRPEHNLSLALAVALNQALRLDKALAMSLALALLDLALSLALSWMVQEALEAVGSQRVPKPCSPSALEEAMGLGWGCSSLLFFSFEFLIPFLMLSIPSTGGWRYQRQEGGAQIDKGPVVPVDRVGAAIGKAPVDRRCPAAWNQVEQRSVLWCLRCSGSRGHGAAEALHGRELAGG